MDIINSSAKLYTPFKQICIRHLPGDGTVRSSVYSLDSVSVRDTMWHLQQQTCATNATSRFACGSPKCGPIA